MIDVQAKIMAQLSAFETDSKNAPKVAAMRDDARERTRQLQEPDPRTLAAEPFPTLVAQFKALLANHESVQHSDDRMRIDAHAAEMTTLGSALNHMGGFEMMRFTLKTFAPESTHRHVDLAWNGVGLWVACANAS